MRNYQLNLSDYNSKNSKNVQCTQFKGLYRIRDGKLASPWKIHTIDLGTCRCRGENSKLRRVCHPSENRLRKNIEKITLWRLIEVSNEESSNPLHNLWLLVLSVSLPKIRPLALTQPKKMDSVYRAWNWNTFPKIFDVRTSTDCPDQISSKKYMGQNSSLIR